MIPAAKLFPGVSPEPSPEPVGRRVTSDEATSFEALLDGPSAERCVAADGEAVAGETAADDEEGLAEETGEEGTILAIEEEAVETLVATASWGSWQFLPPESSKTPQPIGTEAGVGNADETTPEVVIENAPTAPAITGSAVVGEEVPEPVKNAPTTTGTVERSPLTGLPDLPAAAGPEVPAAAMDQGAPIPLPPTQRSAGTPPAANPLENKVLAVPSDSRESARVLTHGIPDAKEHRAMPTLLSQPTLTPYPAAFAAGNELAAEGQNGAAEAVDFAASVPLGVAAEQVELAPKLETSFGHSGGLAFSGEAELPVPADHAPAAGAPAAANAAEVIQHIERTLDRMRALDQSRIEVRLPMQDGGEVIVRLRLEQGQVKAVFQTGSEGLRQALETGWNQFATGSPERELKIGPAVFEPSPSFSSHQSFDHSGRQPAPDDREPGNPALAQVSLEDFLPQRTRSLRPAAAAVNAAPAGPMQTYA